MILLIRRKFKYSVILPKIIDLMKKKKTTKEILEELNISSFNLQQWKKMGKKGDKRFKEFYNQAKRLGYINEYTNRGFTKEYYRIDEELKRKIKQVIESSESYEAYENKLYKERLSHPQYWDGCFCTKCKTRTVAEKESDKISEMKYISMV